MRITHNIHAHTNVSGCGKPHSTVEAIVAAAEEAGLDTVGITDHLIWPLDEIERDFDKTRRAIAAVKSPVKVLMGAEVDMIHPRRLAATPEFVDSLDYMIVPVNHFMPQFRVFPQDRTEEGYARWHLELAEQAVEVGATVIAHPFVFLAKDFLHGRMADPERLYAAYDREELRRVFGKAAERGTAFEINTAKQPPAEFLGEVIAIAQREGMKFAIGRDSHAPEAVGYDGPEAKAALEKKYTALGLRQEDVCTEFKLRR